MDNEKAKVVNKAFASLQGRAYERYLENQKQALAVVYNEAYKKGFQDGRMSREKVSSFWLGEGDGYADGNMVYDHWYCSNCDYCIETDDEDELPKVCPKCGVNVKVHSYEECQ